MQTFLPYSDFRKSLESLDNKRLGKQRVEAYQIISAITGRLRKDGKLKTPRNLHFEASFSSFLN